MSAEFRSFVSIKPTHAIGGIMLLSLSFDMLSSLAAAPIRASISSPADAGSTVGSYASSHAPPRDNLASITIGQDNDPGLLSGLRNFLDGRLSSSEGNVILAQARGTHPEPTLSAAPAAPSDSLEVRFWNTIKDTNVIADFRTYLDAYPDGRFAEQARSRLREIERKGNSAPGNSTTPPVKPVAEPTKAQAFNVVRDCPQCPQLVLIPAGAFNMGSAEMFPFEKPVHQVTIRKPFYMGQREVTFEEWDACVADGGCTYSPIQRGADRGSAPVTNVDWSDAREFVAWLTKKTGKTYRLPSESEWEYAARAGSTTSYPWGRTMEQDRANCSGCNSEPSGGAIATGSYPPNDFGLYDMAGNAAEWVEDCWSDSYKSAPTDGSAWTGPRCQERVLRGGSFNNDPRYLRSASRFKYDFDVRYYTNGFRVAREK